MVPRPAPRPGPVPAVDVLQEAPSHGDPPRWAAADRDALPVGSGAEQGGALGLRRPGVRTRRPRKPRRHTRLAAQGIVLGWDAVRDVLGTPQGRVDATSHVTRAQARVKPDIAA